MFTTCRSTIAQGLPWLRICCSQHFSQIVKVGATKNRLQPRVKIESSIPNSLPTSGDFCLLLITSANSLDPDQARQNVGPDLDPNCLTP